MLKGDLNSTTLANVLNDLAASSSSGSLVLNHSDGNEAQIFMRSGLVCGLTATNRRSDLGAKLVSSGELAPEALSEALEAQRSDLSAWNLAELLVHLGYVEADVVQEFVVEQLHEALWDLMQWTDGRWKFRKNAKTREDIPPVSVVELLESLRERGYEWESIASVVDSPTAIPMLSARGDGAPETTLDSDAWSMLCKIDGTRSVAELASDCGYTLFEAGQVLVTLVDAGLVDITDDAEYDDQDGYAPSALAGALASGLNTTPAAPEADDALSRLTRLATEVTNGGRSAAAASTTNPLQLDVMAAQLSSSPNLTVPISRRSGESFASSMGRVSGALADVLGPAPEMDDDGVDPLLEVRKRQPRTAKPVVPGSETELERKKRLRAAASAELANAQAAAEALRPDHNEHAPTTTSDAPLRLVSLETERARVAANDAEEAARHASEGAAREAAENFARAAAEQAARVAQEQAQRGSAEQADRAAAEAAASLAAAEQAAAEHAAAELAAAQAASEQAAAEQAAAERVAAEQAAEEERAAAARAAAEQAAAQLEAEQAAAHQAAAHAAAESAQRAAMEEAARHAQEQAELAVAQAAAEAALQSADEDVAAAAQRSDDAAAASAMLAELQHTASAQAPVMAVVPDPEPEPEPEPVYASDPFPSAGSGEGADTAALLRELSSLGTEDDGPSLASSAPRAPRPQQADKKVKKKIGLFGL